VPTVLIHGFGAFLDVVDNPAARLAEAVDGQRVGGARVVGEAMPVSYGRGPAGSIARAQELGAMLVIGIGVAKGRTQAGVEAWAHNAADPALSDVDGESLTTLNPRGPARVACTVSAPRLARAMGGVVSEDAGRYVCNAWLYRVACALGDTTPVAFVHVPPKGLAPSAFLSGVGALVRSLS
jgi:pyroglutamyl-peptidase